MFQNWRGNVRLFGDILLILLISKLFALSFYFGLYFYFPQAVLIFLCSIYFLKKNKYFAFLLPIIIPILGVLIFLKPNDFRGAVGWEAWGVVFMLFFSIPNIFISYVLSFLYISLNALRKRIFPSLLGRK